MSLNWFRDRRRVAELQQRLRQYEEEQHVTVQLMKEWGRTYASRYQTLFWVGVTGYVFMSRRRHEDEDARRNVLVELGLAAWAVQRWRHIPERVANRLDRARAELHEFAHPEAAAAAGATEADLT